MLLKGELRRDVVLSLTTKTIVKFDENYEFSLYPQFLGDKKYIFSICDIKGKFEISDYRNNYDKEKKFFTENITTTHYVRNFCIVVERECEKVGYDEYTFSQPTYAQYLKPFQYYEHYFTLPNYKNIKFKYSVKKFPDCHVEYCIENPHKIEINRRKEDYVFTTNYNNKSDHTLHFAFELETWKKPKSTTQSLSENIKQNFHEVMFDTTYADVVIFSSTGKEILTYRCVLAKFSKIFAKIFEESKELPVQIKVEEFDTETITAALDFCYGKTDAIIGKESKIFGFASKYSFSNIMKACSNYFENDISPENVCEIVQIAYTNNLEDLKQKCLQILVENKKEIDSLKLKELPKDIFYDAFFV